MVNLIFSLKMKINYLFSLYFSVNYDAMQLDSRSPRKEEVMSKTPESFETRLERLRKKKGLTAKNMASQINVAESTYRDWEKGRGLKLPPLEEISKVLSISVTELITGHPADLTEHINSLVEIEEKLAQVRLKLTSRI